MPEPTDEKLKHITATANRLRLLQIDFADENAEVRRKFLSEEIERALSTIVPGERQAFLEELIARFPTWDPNVELMAPEEDTAALSPTDERELQDPSFLVTRLIALLPSLSEKEKQALVERLRQAGLAPAVRREWPDEAAKALESELQLSPNESIDTARLLELSALLAHFARSLDQLAWETWRRMAPRSTIRRPDRLRGAMRRFVAGRADVPYGQLSQDLDKLRRLLASLISAIGQAGRQFAGTYLKRLSPYEIELLIRTERGRKLSFTSPEKKCWDKYVELAGRVSEESVEREIVEAVAKSAELLMKGGGR